MIYALDTNTIIFILNGELDVCNALREKKNGNSITVPPIVYYEIKRGFHYNNAIKKQQHFESFLAKTLKPITNEYEVAERAAKTYAERRKKGLSIHDDDILIASWCSVINATLVTDNTKHFEQIEGLNLENWRDKT